MKSLKNELFKQIESKTTIKKHRKNQNTDQIIFDYVKIHEKLRQQQGLTLQINRKIIMILKYTHKTYQEFKSINAPTYREIEEYLHRLKTAEQKLEKQLTILDAQNGLHSINYVRKCIKHPVGEVAKAAQKHWDRASKNQSLDMGQLAKQENYKHEEEVKEEMLELVARFKNYALEIGQDLKKDESTLQKINEKQDRTMDNLKSKGQAIEGIIKNQKIGFFQLLAMALIGVLLWVFGIFVIIII